MTRAMILENGRYPEPEKRGTLDRCFSMPFGSSYPGDFQHRVSSELMSLTVRQQRLINHDNDNLENHGDESTPEDGHGHDDHMW